MKQSSTLTKEQFDNLLGWLADDRNEAGAEYEEIRKGLIRFFRTRDCADPIALADETLNRVANKLPTKEADRKNIPLKYIYGFALNVCREYERISAKMEIQLNQNLPLAALFLRDLPDNKSKDVMCLERCLAKCLPDEIEMMFEYYGQDKSTRFEVRRKMAKDRNITVQALHTRIYRIKNSLKICIEKCMDEKTL